MGQLIPENVIRKVDAIGRVTLPKGLRDRMFLEENAELELFTANVDGRQCVCLTRPIRDDETIAAAIELLEAHGYEVIKND